MPTLGRLPSPTDPRDHSLSRYVPRLALMIDALPLVVRPARRYLVLDQGSTPRCVGFSAALTRTVSEWQDVKRTLLFDADELYLRCKQLDGIPNEDGTYPRVAAEILLKEGMLVSKVTRGSGVTLGTRLKIAGYARLSTLEEIKASVLEYGSAWLGSVWSNSWFVPDSRGVLPEPDSIVGGHAYTAIGYNDKKITPVGRGALLIQNSWGREWGLTGKFWLPYGYMDLTNEWDWEAWKTIDILGDR